MPILSPLQLRSPRGRLLVVAMYVILVIGAAWMVYPFLLMLSGSVKSDVDIRQFDIVPRYLWDDSVLFRKFEEQRYGGLLDWFTTATRYHDNQGRPLYSFEQLPTPGPVEPAVLDDWDQFLSQRADWPPHFFQLGHSRGQRTVPEVVLEYQMRLRRAFPELLAGELPTRVNVEFWQERNYQPMTGPFASVYAALRRDLPARYFIPTSVEGCFITSYLLPRYGTGKSAIEKLNEKWGTRYTSLYEVTLSSTAPTHPGQREDWASFVEDGLSPRFISADGQSIDGPEFRWRDFLRQKYRDDIAALNAAHGSDYAAFSAVLIPVLAADWQIMKEHRGAILRDNLTRNYRIVWGYLAGRGRAFRNTLIFCAINVLTALIVNPLAAYALARFQPRWGYAALLILMATMAFPAEVTQIPAFLMLRELGLLNTFAALILPAAANGYSIFLLKGFFDSLPKELYESANIDGAGELRIFTNITLPLSGPILAVIALGAFTSAYGAFMFALLVCQKESMWTLMVYLYQLQQSYGTPVIFASLVLAAIPTLLVFIFCQNIILRGIVVPVEK